jgi:hypothetical protein
LEATKFIIEIGTALNNAKKFGDILRAVTFRNGKLEEHIFLRDTKTTPIFTSVLWRIL